jgi:hypothetical protein
VVTEDQMAMIFSAFLGAYLFGIQELVRRYNTFDLLPQVYSSIFVRMVVATGIVTVAALFIGEGGGGTLGLIVAFLIGMFPKRGIEWLQTKTKDVFDARQRESSMRALTDIVGIGSWHEARLAEIGIDDAQNLATTDLRKLLLTTQFDTQELVSWIDQSILYTKVGVKMETLRALNISSLYELNSMLGRLIGSPLPTTPEEIAKVEGTKVEILLSALGTKEVTALLQVADGSNYPNYAHIVKYYREYTLLNGKPDK